MLDGVKINTGEVSGETSPVYIRNWMFPMNLLLAQIEPICISISHLQVFFPSSQGIALVKLQSL
jgi:hypothetical protein